MPIVRICKLMIVECYYVFVMRISLFPAERAGVCNRRHYGNQHGGTICPFVRIDAHGILVPRHVDDRELPRAHAVALLPLHAVAYVRTEIVAHAHRRVSRDADDRIALRVGIGLVRQTVRQSRAPRHVERH